MFQSNVACPHDLGKNVVAVGVNVSRASVPHDGLKAEKGSERGPGQDATPKESSY
jgi:hypothetical protein